LVAFASSALASVVERNVQLHVSLDDAVLMDFPYIGVAGDEDALLDQLEDSQKPSETAFLVEDKHLNLCATSSRTLWKKIDFSKASHGGWFRSELI
jgi:hypothetical protein